MLKSKSLRSLLHLLLLLLLYHPLAITLIAIGLTATPKFQPAPPDHSGIPRNAALALAYSDVPACTTGHSDISEHTTSLLRNLPPISINVPPPQEPMLRQSLAMLLKAGMHCLPKLEVELAQSSLGLG